MSIAESRSGRRARPRGASNQARFDEVIDAASEVFREKGYLAATLQDIAGRLGMLKGSLYYYIDSKEDLLYEILRRAHLQGLEYIEQGTATGATDPLARITTLIRHWLGGLPSLDPALRIEALQYDHRYLSPSRRAEILAMRRQITRSFEEVIAAGVRDGSFHPGIDPHTAAATVLAVVNNHRHLYRPGGPLTWQQLTDWIVGLFVGGLTHGPEPSADAHDDSGDVGRQDEAPAR